MKGLNSRKYRIIAGSVAALVLVVVAFFVRFPLGPRPECHKIIDGALQQWMLESGNTNSFLTNSYPNVGGREAPSFAAIQRLIGGGPLPYGYVPGLREDDPGDLVFMYLKEKTRYSWHGDTKPNLFSPRRWMVLSPRFAADTAGNTCAEGGELLDTGEFKAKLEQTLAFLKANQRPFWQVIVAEQSEVLKSIKD